MDSYKKLLLANKAWVQDRLNLDPDFFERSSQGQTPRFLWIGCSDSRVPAEDITGAEPGELFVHRNIANMVVHTDLNMLAVLQYAVEVLPVKHIILCRHPGCGGVQSGMGHQHLGMINKWLRNIKDVYRIHREELERIPQEEKRYDRLVELNVHEQLYHLAETSIVQQAWHDHQRPMLHGWIYDMRSGLLKDLYTLTPGDTIDPIYKIDFPESLPEPPTPGEDPGEARAPGA